MDDFDKELERRGLAFVRYADDAMIFVHSPRAGERVLTSVTRIPRPDAPLAREPVQKRGRPTNPAPIPRLQIPEAAGPISDWPIPRFISAREAPPAGGSLVQRIQAINRFLAGWVGYFALVDTPTPLRDLDSWIRHRVRAIVWRRWKRVRTRYRELRALHVPEWKARELANARKGPWRMAAGPLNSVLTVSYWDAQGLHRLHNLYEEARLRWS